MPTGEHDGSSPLCSFVSDFERFKCTIAISFLQIDSALELLTTRICVSDDPIIFGLDLLLSWVRTAVVNRRRIRPCQEEGFFASLIEFRCRATSHILAHLWLRASNAPKKYPQPTHLAFVLLLLASAKSSSSESAVMLHYCKRIGYCFVFISSEHILFRTNCNYYKG